MRGRHWSWDGPTDEPLRRHVTTPDPVDVGRPLQPSRIDLINAQRAGHRDRPAAKVGGPLHGGRTMFTVPTAPQGSQYGRVTRPSPTYIPDTEPSPTPQVEELTPAERIQRGLDEALAKLAAM